LPLMVVVPESRYIVTAIILTYTAAI